MLSYALAIAVALSSLVLFLTAFFMSDIHRKDDFLWSAAGLIYALVLWFCARNITGAVLLGQAFASVLLISFVWQTLKLRKAVANPDRAIAISNFSVLQGINSLLKGKKNKPQSVTNTPVTGSSDVVTESEISIPETTSTEKKSSVKNSKASQKKVNKGGSFGKFFGNKKKSTITNTRLDEILDDEKEGSKPEAPIKDDTQVLEEKQKETKFQKIADTAIKDSVKKEEASIAAKTEISPEVAIADPSENIIENDLEQGANQTPVEEKLEVEKPANKIVEKNPVVEQETSESSLDSLETVEVAEVLEALPENLSGDKNNNPNNIIEVTSTDIDEVMEPQQIDTELKSEEG